MSHIDEQIAEALTHGPDTLTYILAQALTTARARVAELEARPVVVPEPTSDEWRSIAESARSSDMVDFLAGASAYGLWLRGKIPSAIPADRVLGEGMVAVDREDVRLAIKELDLLWPCDRVKRMRGRFFDALRANQGGTAT